MNPGESDQAGLPSSLRLLTVMAGVSVCLYGLISLQSWHFQFISVPTERPILLVLALFAVAFAIYVAAIRVACRAPQTGQLVTLIVTAAVLFRVAMLFSLPIQEVDIYRYLWDGTVSTSGVSPFQYSPLQVSSADSLKTVDPALKRLAVLRDRDPVSAEILQRVHFPELPTIYPPISQAVFATATLTTPSDSALLTRLIIMKAWLIGFDIATLFLVIGLLRICKKPVGLCLIYGWCPLLMKEVANSGHLDAIAVFLTTLAIYLAARFLAARSDASPQRWLTAVPLGWVALVLAMAVGAKIYPVVLAPLLLLSLWKVGGWRIVLVPTAIFAVTTAVLFSAMTPGGRPDHDPSRGVVTFLRQWEMNDFVFLLTIENLKPTEGRGAHEIAWFSVVPESARHAIIESTLTHLNVAPVEVPFLTARVLTAALFLVVAIMIAWRTDPSNVTQFCEGAFLTIAWFWLLCPTQNPWYWTWALPLLPFARSRVWLAMSGLALIYYLRFWLSYHFAETAVLGTPYTGAAFFDFIVTWIEFGPWFVVLMAVALRRRTENREKSRASSVVRSV